MELQVPHSICPKVSQEGVLWRETARDRRNIEDAVQLEEDKDSRSRGVPGPCAYAGKYPAQLKCITVHGVLERKEQFDDIRQTCKLEVQVWQQTFLA